MKTKASALLPVLRSEVVGELLARFYLVPERAWTLTELATSTATSLPTTSREVSRMVTAGLLRETKVGRTRQVRANTDNRLFGPLREIIVLTYGPVPVLEDELGRVEGVERGFVYGSWAARHEGVEGPEPNDIDVLVVGTPDPDDLFDAAERARRRLGRPVSIRRVSPRAWGEAEPGDPFLRHVRASPLVVLSLGGER